MRINGVLIILTILLISCNQKKEELPNILSREQMVNILTDIQILEANLSFKKKSTIKSEQLTKKYYESVFLKYNISREEFEESLFYYENNIEELDAIYSDVITNLNKMQTEVNSELNAEYDAE